MIGTAWLPAMLLAAAGAHAQAPGDGPMAAHIDQLWQLTLALCSVVFAVLLAVLGAVLLRRPHAAESDAPLLDESYERASRRTVGAAVGVSVLLLLLLIAAGVLTDRALAALPKSDALHIELSASQWWWEAQYDDAQSARRFTTANELHVPVGRPVIVTLRSNDVIHSLWVPNLHGKQDLLPGRSATLALQADLPGLWSARCAEFCGFQHGFMSLDIVAEAPETYAQWAEQQRQGAPEPADEQQRHGRDLFVQGPCAMCHAVQGTDANARRAPDLTHLAGRATLAAGVLANTPENLARWIRDPQQFKPGANMPPQPLSDDDLAALVAWLGTLR